MKWRIGVLAPHADVGPESEIQAMAPADVVVHGARAYFGAMRAGGEMDPTIPLAHRTDHRIRPALQALGDWATLFAVWDSAGGESECLRG